MTFRERCCRGCATGLRTTFVDLGHSPIANNFLRADQLLNVEPTYPLHVFVCHVCFLVQLEAYSTREHIFADDYAYFSSYSDTWLAHAQAYVDMAVPRFNLGPTSRVVELASNDGYLLQYFIDAGIPVLGIEPAESVAEAARTRNVPTRTTFFGEAVGREYREAGKTANLIVANNVLAHVPDLHDFVAGVALLLNQDGWATFEFPHVLELIRNVEFDTIYHEHYSYFSLLALEPIFIRHGLVVVEATRLPTHGGSLRLFVRHRGAGAVHESVDSLRDLERAEGLHRIETYAAFPAAVERCRTAIRAFFERTRESGKSVVGYGAPAKGNTFLNYCKFGPSQLPFTVDRNVHKVGKLLPGTRIPIRSVEELQAAPPDYVLILPWNLRAEIEHQLRALRYCGTKFLTAVPAVEISA